MAVPTTMPRMQTRSIRVADGVELAADAWHPAAPTGVPFLLVHGLASNARTWEGVAARLLAYGHPVVTVDLRGHGQSSKPDGPYDVATVADDLAALIDVMALERPIVAGQSWGGNVVVELAARHPAAVRGIVCVDGGWLEPSREFPDWDACRVALAPPRLAGRRFSEIEGYIRSAHPDWPESGIRGTLANFEVRADGTVAPWLTSTITSRSCAGCGSTARPGDSRISAFPSCWRRSTVATRTGRGANAGTCRRRRP